MALEHTDRVVRAQDRDRGAEVDAARPRRRDGAEHHVTGWHRKVVGVVLADPEEVDADLVGQDTLFDDVADRVRVRQGSPRDVVGDVSERVEAEDEWELGLLVPGGELAHGSIRHGDQFLSVLFDDVSTTTRLLIRQQKWR